MPKMKQNSAKMLLLTKQPLGIEVGTETADFNPNAVRTQNDDDARWVSLLTAEGSCHCYQEGTKGGFAGQR